MTKNNINIQHKIYCPVLAQLVERWTVTVFLCGYPQVAGSIPANRIKIHNYFA